jgi:hypothetical protein
MLKDSGLMTISRATLSGGLSASWAVERRNPRLRLNRQEFQTAKIRWAHRRRHRIQQWSLSGPSNMRVLFQAIRRRPIRRKTAVTKNEIFEEV